MTAIHWQPIGVPYQGRFAMVRRADKEREGDDPAPPRYDAPGWIKGAIAVLAALVWGFTVVTSVNAGRAVDPYVHVVFIAVLGAVFGIDVRRWNK